MPRIYIKSNTHLLEKFDKGYTVPVGMSALKRTMSSKSTVPSMMDEMGADGMVKKKHRFKVIQK